MTKMKAERKRRGWTQTQLASRAGLHQSQISAFEKAARQPNEDHARRIAVVLKLDASELLDEAAEEAVAT